MHDIEFSDTHFWTSDISIFCTDSTENLYTNSKRVEDVWYEVSGAIFFGPPNIYIYICIYIIYTF